LEALAEMKPCWILDQAKEGTLELFDEVDPNFADKEQGLTPLMMAAAFGHRDLVRRLIEGRARVNDQTKEGLSALAFAADCGWTAGTTDCFNELLKAGARIDIKIGKTYKREWHRLRGLQTTLAHEVCRIGDVQKLDLLLRARADITALNETGVPPLFEAVSSGNTECTRRLVEANASVQIHHRTKTARWPNYYEKMCIVSFMAMHCDKTIPLLKMCKEVLGFGWDHVYSQDSQEMSLYQCFALSTYTMAYEDSLEALDWCWDNGMPEDCWSNEWVKIDPKAVVALLGVNTPSWQNVGFKMFDRKMLPTGNYYQADQFNESIRMGWIETWAVTCYYVKWENLTTHMPMWENYQVLLAARGN
jgi:ankyrin repeat protein